MHLKTYQYADVNTGHISEADAKTLAEDSDATASSNLPTGVGTDSLTVFAYDYGFFVHIPDDKDEETINLLASRYSPELITLYKQAQEQGCTFLRLDADGEPYEELRTFNW